MKLLERGAVRFVLGFTGIILLKIVLQYLDKYSSQTVIFYMSLQLMPAIYMFMGMLLPFMLSIELSYEGKSRKVWIISFCLLLMLAYGPVISALIVQIPYINNIFLRFVWPIYLKFSDAGFIQIISSLGAGMLLIARPKR